MSVLRLARSAGGGGPPPGTSAYDAHLRFDGDFSDLQGRTWTANGSPAIDTSVKKFGSGSLYVPGDGSCLISPTDSSLGFASGPFTIAGWTRRAGTGSDQSIYMRGLLTGGLDQTSLAHAIFFASDNTLNFRIYRGSGGIVNISGGVITDTTSFFHWQFCCDGSTLYAFVNGTLVGSAAYLGQNDDAAWRSVIGSFGPTWGIAANARIDEIVVDKGNCWNTSSFTPPTAAYPD